MIHSQRSASVWRQSDGLLLAAQIEIANTSLRRAVGLLGRTQLREEQGLWIRPSSGVHTFGMSFAIDVVGLDREHRVVRLWENLRPHRMTRIVSSVRSVLELPAGSIGKHAICLGDSLQFQE